MPCKIMSVIEWLDEAIKNQIHSTTIIGTFDVSSLYTNILHHDEGGSACCEALGKSGHTSPPINDLKALMYDLLIKNNFTFMDDYYLQIFGTSMGTRMAPSFTCPFMSRLEQQMLHAALCRPWIWWRFIDDVFFIWTSDEESLHAFTNHINSFLITIKFTSEISHQQVNFLDVSIRTEHNTLITDLYTKPTDTHQYLHSTSCHPRHCKNSIAYSQALRLRHICSYDSDLSCHTQNLKMHLVSRGHSDKKVQQAFSRARSVPRLSALEQKPINDATKSRIPLVVTFHPPPPSYPQYFRSSSACSSWDSCSGLQTSRNLRDVIVRAKVPPLTDVNSSPIQHYNFRRGANQCVVCQDHIKEGEHFNQPQQQHFPPDPRQHYMLHI